MGWDILLATLGVLCLITGLIGAILPLPGPPLSYAGIWLLQATRFADFSPAVLWGLGIGTVVVSVLDYVVPIWGLKKFGGSPAGVWGSTIGLMIGLFVGPLGIFAGAFIGGLAGELLSGKDSGPATRAAIGAFLGFLFGVVLKIAFCGLMLWYAGTALWVNIQ